MYLDVVHPEFDGAWIWEELWKEHHETDKENQHVVRKWVFLDHLTRLMNETTGFDRLKDVRTHALCARLVDAHHAGC